MDDYCKRSGQIPAFGDWDYANELPITQYFECARQAGLIRFSSSSGESGDAAYVRPDLYAVHLNKPSRNVVPSRKTRGREKRCPRGPHVMEQKKQQPKLNKVCDVTEPPTKQHHYPIPDHTYHKSDTVPRPPRRVSANTSTRPRPPKPVDEDLYKIPPELLHTTKRKKMLGLFSCLVPACAS